MISHLGPGPKLFVVRKALGDTFVFTFFLFCYLQVCHAALPSQACPISPHVISAAQMKTKMKTKMKMKMKTKTTKTKLKTETKMKTKPNV